ncbi:MAG: type II secretion system protein [Pirellulales bacterium]|nr:type II secretion system protein [Pirellulales bacterium]
MPCRNQERATATYKSTHPQRCGAFTLVELLVVIAIISKRPSTVCRGTYLPRSISVSAVRLWSSRSARLLLPCRLFGT